MCIRDRHYAAQFGEENILRALIELGANIEAKNKYEETPLHQAAQFGKENTFRALIDLGAQITPSTVKSNLEKCNLDLNSTKRDLDSTRQSLDSCNTTISEVPGIRTEIQNLQSNLNSVREELRVCRRTSGTEFLNPKILDMEGFDTIFQMLSLIHI